jgi:hypothetical protein
VVRVVYRRRHARHLGCSSVAPVVEEDPGKSSVERITVLPPPQKTLHPFYLALFDTHLDPLMCLTDRCCCLV